jgi:hypothetical protein
MPIGAASSKMAGTAWGARWRGKGGDRASRRACVSEFAAVFSKAAAAAPMSQAAAASAKDVGWPGG